ncbi:MAG: glutamate 5-kinase [Cellvibrionales bacterium TMED49]|nr:MAG: glutamate 5-kinase [Cellvibrionales bacterium TMED49]
MSRIFIRGTRRWVVKIGSSILTNNGLGLDRVAIKSWVRQIDYLINQGIEVVLVSSGAIAEGMVRLNWTERPKTIAELQASAAVGQTGLVQAYQESFRNLHRNTAQILLDHDDIANRQRYLNARSVLVTLLKHQIVPIANENDTVSTEEIRFGDNDRLAAMVANLIDADLLVILTDREGLYSADPAKDASAQLISETSCDSEDLDKLVGESISMIGRGGMITKLQAARQAGKSGCSTVIAGGHIDNIICKVAAADKVGTLLFASKKPLAARKQWLAGQLRVHGRLILDAGAVNVLMCKGKSLLPVGVVGVDGDFTRGDYVSCVDQFGAEVARGLINYSSKETEIIMGLSTLEVKAKFDISGEDELIHRDNLVLI